MRKITASNEGKILLRIAFELTDIDISDLTTCEKNIAKILQNSSILVKTSKNTYCLSEMFDTKAINEHAE